MSKLPDSSEDQPMNPHEQSIGKLLKLAGERDVPGAAATGLARQAAERSWQAMLRRQSATPVHVSRSRMWLWAAAASLAVLALALTLHRPGGSATARIARVTAADSGAMLSSNSGVAVRAAAPVHAGAILTTTGGRVALTLGDTLSLRVDRRTRLRFDAPDRVTLLDGSLYVDSGGINAVPELTVATPAGEVRHVGTQFQVSVAGEGTHVRVREGRVIVTSGVRRFDIAAGDALAIGGGQPQLQRGLPSHGVEWEWATAIAPSFAIENRPLAEFLAWLAREHGWQLRYADDSLQQRTHDIRLHGALDGLDSAGMIERVALTTGIPLSVDGGVLRVGAAGAPR
jgi:ferric-dicitrate binding protein FerR (iron transport regulator)